MKVLEENCEAYKSDQELMKSKVRSLSRGTNYKENISPQNMPLSAFRPNYTPQLVLKNSNTQDRMGANKTMEPKQQVEVSRFEAKVMSGKTQEYHSEYNKTIKFVPETAIFDLPEFARQNLNGTSNFNSIQPSAKTTKPGFSFNYNTNISEHTVKTHQRHQSDGLEGLCRHKQNFETEGTQNQFDTLVGFGTNQDFNNTDIINLKSIQSQLRHSHQPWQSEATKPPRIAAEMNLSKLKSISQEMGNPKIKAAVLCDRLIDKSRIVNRSNNLRQRQSIGSDLLSTTQQVQNKTFYKSNVDLNKNLSETDIHQKKDIPRKNEIDKHKAKLQSLFNGKLLTRSKKELSQTQNFISQKNSCTGTLKGKVESILGGSSGMIYEAKGKIDSNILERTFANLYQKNRLSLKSSLMIDKDITSLGGGNRAREGPLVLQSCLDPIECRKHKKYYKADSSQLSLKEMELFQGLRRLMEGSHLYKKFTSSSLKRELFDPSRCLERPPEQCGYGLRFLRLNIYKETLEIMNANRVSVEKSISIGQLIKLGSHLPEYQRAINERGKEENSELIPFHLLTENDGALELISLSQEEFSEWTRGISMLVKNVKLVNKLQKRVRCYCV